MLRFKAEVRIRAFRPAIADVLAEAALWSLLERVDVEVNAIDDGQHGINGPTLHGSSLAIDLDTVGDKPAETRALGEHLRRTLDPQFDVLWEGTHIHVEWDARRPPLRQVATT